MATYKHLRSSTANKRPTTSIADGQLAINTNTASPGLFFKDSAGTGIVKVGPVHVGTTAPNSTPAAGGSSGNYLGEQWLDTSVSPAQMKVWNGSAWIGVVADELPVSKLQDGAAGQIVQTDSAGTGVEWSSTANLPLGSAAAPAYRFQGDGDSGVYSPGANQVAISTAGTGRLFVDASGNVGVGTTGPTNSLEVVGGATTNLFAVKASSGGDCLAVTARAAGNGAIVSALNSAQGDYEPLEMNGEFIYFQTRTGAGTVSERARLDASGRLGIGTSNVTRNLVVQSASQSDILIRSGNTNYAQLLFGDTDAEYRGAISYDHQTDKLNLVSAGSTAVTIDSSGRLGVGTSSPGSYSTSADNLVVYDAANSGITIASSSTGSGQIYFADGTTGGDRYRGTIIYDHASDSLRFDTAALTRVTIDTWGRLLVGTSSARSNFDNSTNQARLQIEGTDNSTGAASIIQNFNGATSGSRLILGKSNGSSVGSNTIVAADNTIGAVSFQGNDGSEFVQAAEIKAQVDGTPAANNMPGRLVFSTTPSGSASLVERMRLSANGRLDAFVTNATYGVYFGHSSAAGTTQHFIACGYSATAINTGTISFKVSTNGDVQNTNNSYGAISDIKLKENIVDASSQWDDIKALRPVNYNFKEGQTHTQLGLIAQEVELVSPGLVSESPDRDAEGNDLGTVTKSVNYSVLYMKAVKALQEAMERIEVLEQRLTDAGIA